MAPLAFLFLNLYGHLYDYGVLQAQNSASRSPSPSSGKRQGTLSDSGDGGLPLGSGRRNYKAYLGAIVQ